MNSPLADAIKALPQHLTKADLEDLPNLLSQLNSRAEEYGAQSIALTFIEFLKEQGQPEFGFELNIDREDGTYYLYCDGVDGIEVDEDDFSTDEEMAQFCQEKNDALETFTQELNDSPWREDQLTREMVNALNSVNWRSDQAEQVICQALQDNGVDGAAFLGSLRASEQAETLATSTPAAKKSPGRRGL